VATEVTEPADVDWDHARDVVIRLEDLLAEHNAGAIDFFEKSASILRAALGQAAASVEDPVTSWDLANLFLQSHVFVMPYSHEGFGMAYLEAMAFAMPVVASANGAVKEFDKPGQNGFLIELDDSESVNICIHRFLSALAESAR
jgi:glycosyltransferase involved in cell wall biosynthesis